ncbi:MAG: bifunctional precorrin-2 dehydrogenase/sirohydrochlorin ferrochelatase [Acidobacteriota bacterium]|nr:MAG: bifunctional precorrin-2 dehydrogenase/sirohydrochlorin ferrochelatase [Acidobacteriota bacterium]
MKTYPVSLNLEGRTCLVIGSGPLIDEKATNLLAAGARICRREQFDPADLPGNWLIVADVDEDQAERIFKSAEESGKFVNIVDKPRFCSFILPSIGRMGDLSLAVSTAGKSPSLAALIRQEFERRYAGYGELLDILGETREEIKQKLPNYADRKCFYRGLLESSVLDRIRGQEPSVFRKLIDDKLEEYQNACH